MSSVWAVIRREYLQRVASRWFVIATLAGPLVLLAVLVLPILVSGPGDPVDDRLAVQDRTGVLYDEVAGRLRQGGWVLERVGTSDAESDRTLGAVASGELGGYLVLGPETLRSGRAQWYGEDALSPMRALALRQAVVTAALTVQLEQQGVDPGALLGGGALQTTVLGGGGTESDDTRFLLGFLGAFLLYMVILLYAVAVMRATLQEKTDRLVEIILSAMEPWHLMLGKILGVGAVGLTQLGVWAGFGALLTGLGLPWLAGRPGVPELGPLPDAVPGGRLLAVFVGLFLGGYFIYASLYAAVGAMCSSEDEAQQAQFPVMLLILVPMVLITPVLDEPTSALSTVLSLVPFFTPVLMWPRAVAGAVPGWQLLLAFALMGLTVVVVARIAGRIYRVGVLMTGKRPTVREVWRWAREG